MPKKEPAPIVNQTISNTTDLPSFANDVSGVADAKNDSFGNVSMSKNITSFLGSNSGFKKAIPSADSHSFLATAHPRSSKSKIIGLTNLPSAISISPKSSTPFVTAPTSAKITASSLL